MFSFKKKETEFFDYFVESARYFHQGALIMDEVLLDPALGHEKLRQITDIEHEADAVNDRIIDRLNQSFITPIDREDIYALANGLDDCVDNIHEMLQRFVIYKVRDTKEGAVQMAKLIIEAAGEMMNATGMLADLKKNQGAVLEAAYKIERMESEGDRIFRQEIALLFDSVKDPIELIKWKDIFENLEETLDHCEEVSDMIRGVVMKYA